MSKPPSAIETHISSARFRLPYDSVWKQLTNPLKFPQLYPGWVSHIEPTARPGVYSGVGPLGDEFTVAPRLSRELGIIDFEVTDSSAHVEFSRSRLFLLKDGGCLLVHLAERWEGMSDQAWAQHQRTTDADLEHARSLLERTPPADVEGW